MFEAGLSEAILALLVALIVLGPERLPAVVRWVAGWIRRWRSFSAAVQREMNATLPTHALQETLQAGRAEVRAATSLPGAGDEMRSLQAELDAALVPAQPPQRYRVTAPVAAKPAGAKDETSDGVA